MAAVLRGEDVIEVIVKMEAGSTSTSIGAQRTQGFYPHLQTPPL